MGKIFGIVKEKNSKPKKKKNEHNRHRNIIINFRVSEQEKKVIDARREMTGKKKQDYYRQACMHQRVLVMGNVKSFDKIKEMVREINDKLTEEPDLRALSKEQVESLKMILEILDDLYGGDGNVRRPKRVQIRLPPPEGYRS